MAFIDINRAFFLPSLACLGAALLVSGCASGRNGGPPPAVQQEQIALSESDPRNVGASPVASDPGMVPLLVRTGPSVTAAQANTLFTKLGLRVVQQFPPQNGILWSLDASKQTRDESSWVALMQKQTEVQTAEVDLTRKLAIPIE